MNFSSVDFKVASTVIEKILEENDVEISKQCKLLNIDVFSIPRNFVSSPEKSLSSHKILEERIRMQNVVRKVYARYEQKGKI